MKPAFHAHPRVQQLVLTLTAIVSYGHPLSAAPLAPPTVQLTASGLHVEGTPNSQLFVSDDLVHWELAPLTTPPAGNFPMNKRAKFFRVVQDGKISDAAEFNLSQHPPIRDILISSVDSQGAAATEVTFESSPGALTIPLEVGGAVVIFRDDGTSGDRIKGDGVYTRPNMQISLQEVQELNDFINGLPTNFRTQPIYKGREWIGNVPVNPLPISLNGLPPGTPLVIKGGILGANPTVLPSKSLGSPPIISTSHTATSPITGTGTITPVNPFTVGSWDKSLMITDLSVVNDPIRTFDPCAPQGTNPGTPMGAWTFGRLITDMTPPGVLPEDFVRRWLETWIVNQTINNDVVASRANLQTTILTPWEIASGVSPGGPLDLSKAPFRLCAIVNRVDLRQQNGSPYGGGGPIKNDPCNPLCEAGEARFVFCALGPITAGGGNPTGGGPVGGSGGYNQRSCELPFTVILEYCVPKHGCDQIKAWGCQWLALESIPFGPAYNAALQAITNQFALPGQGVSGPQNSAISQIRANEILQAPWEMREWRIFKNDSDAGWLREVTVKQTPAWSHNGTPDIDNFLASAPGAFSTPGVSVPLMFMSKPFLGGGSPMSGFLGFPTYWDGTSIGSGLALDDRHSFSLNTCSGCHHGETGNYKSNPAGNINEFTHVSERPFNLPSTLSGFLTGITTGPPNPALAGAPNESWNKTFSDLIRRHVDLIMVCKQPCFLRFLDVAMVNVH